MKFRNFCLVVLGAIDGVKLEINRIAATEIRYVEAKGIVIATFSAQATSNELREFFVLNNRTFLLFELNDENYGVHFANKAIHTHLFGEIEERGNEIIDYLTKELSQNPNASLITETQANLLKNSGGTPSDITIKHTRQSNESGNDIDGIDIDSLSVEEKGAMISSILDKGVENLSKEDKKLLKRITKKKKK